MTMISAPTAPAGRWTRFKSSAAGIITAISQSTNDWFRSFSRRKILVYLLIQLFTLGILSAYPLSALVLISVSAAMPLGLETMFRLTGFVITQIASAIISNAFTGSVLRRATGNDIAPLGIGDDNNLDSNLNSNNTRVTPDRIINALAIGDHARALHLVATVDVRYPHSLMALCAEAIRRNASDVFTHLLQLPEVQQRLADNNNRLLIVAVRERCPNMVIALLANQRVKDLAAISNNEALREACSIGQLEIVEALLACQTVTANITFNHNEAVRLAETNGHFDVVARLLAIPAVANYQAPHGTVLNFTPRTSDRLHVPFNNYAFDPYSPANLGFADLFNYRQPRQPQAQRDLRDIANNHESAMAQLDDNQQRGFAAIQQRYQNTFQERGLDSILAEIRGFLIENYHSNPVRHQGRALPLEFDASLPGNVQALYYNNKAHTAYRYLFLHPNPWISPRASHVNHHPNGGLSASISSDNKARIAYLWLAASDEQAPLPMNSTRADVKRLFAELILAGAGRGHNYDNNILNRINSAEIDDGEGDKPTCGMGVSGWVTQFLTLITDNPESRAISKDIVTNKFKSILIADGGHAEAVFTKLEALSKTDLAKTKEALTNLIAIHFGNKEELDEEERRLVEHLEPSQAAVDATIEECKTYFGAGRITGRVERLSHASVNFNSYEEYLRNHLARNILGHYYTDIDAKINSLEKASLAKKGAGKVITFTPKPLKKSHDKGKDNSDDQDAKKRNSSQYNKRR